MFWAGQGGGYGGEYRNAMGDIFVTAATVTALRSFGTAAPGTVPRCPNFACLVIVACLVCGSLSSSGNLHGV